MNRAPLAVAALLVACALAPADEPTTRPVSELAKPALITLSVKDATVKSVLDAMQKQSKITPTLSAGQPDLLETKISIDLDQVPWIEALMRVCEAANLNPYNYGDRWTISPRGNQRLLGPRDVRGPAMVALTSVVVDSNITYDQTNRTTHQLSVSGVLAVEPKVEIDGVSQVSNVKLVDNLGRTFDVELRGGASPAAVVNLRRDFTFTVALPDLKSERIKSIEGMLIAPALLERKRLSIPNLLGSENQQFVVGGANVTIGSVRTRSSQVYEVDFVFDRGSLPDSAFPRLRANSTGTQPRQTNKSDPANVRVQRFADHDGKMTVTLYVQFQRPVDAEDGDARRVVDLEWDLPVRYVDTSIPFLIEDIPLP